MPSHSIDLLGPGGADDGGRDVVVLQHPRDRELRHASGQLVGDRLEQLHALEHVVAHPAA